MKWVLPDWAMGKWDIYSLEVIPHENEWAAKCNECGELVMIGTKEQCESFCDPTTDFTDEQCRELFGTNESFPT